jgi:uncharacterized RDD family membrane protein YckC
VAALEKLSIDTPEQIALEFQLATIGSRFLALAADTVLQLLAAAALLVIALAVRLLTGPFWPGAPTWVFAVVLLGWFTLYYGYFALFETMWSGQTPGKRLMGLRVIHTSGRPISAYEAILRNIVRIVDQMPGIYAVGMVSVFLSERSQRLGDLAASSVVVHERLSEGEAGGVEVRAHDPAAPRHGADRLADAELLVVETFLRRRHELDGWARVANAERIARRLRDKLGLEHTGGNEEFLEQLLAEYRAGGRYR